MKSIQPLKHISIRGRRGVAGLPAAARAGRRHGVWGIVLLTVVFLVFTGCASQKGPEAGQPVPRVSIQSITPQEADTRTEIVIEGSDQILQYTSFQLTEPLRLIVDITDADLDKFKDKITVNKGAVIDITPSQVDNIARLEIALSQSVDTKVYQAGGKLMVELAKPVEAAKASPEAAAAPVPEAPKEQAAPAAEAAAVVPAAGGEAGTAKIVRSIKATASKQGAKVVITADGTMKPNSFMIEGKRLVIDVPGAKSRVRPSVVPVRKGGLDKVRVGQHTTPDQKVRVVLDLTKPMDYTVTPEGNTLVVAMTIATSPKPEEKPQERAAAQPQEAATAVAEKAEKEASQAAPQEAAQAPAPVAAPPQERAEVRQQLLVGEAMVMGTKKYGGRRISLDLQDADLVNVLRLFGELANLNMILSPDVKGKVTVRLVNIPWDQAMEIILKMNGLGYAIEDNILRIASLSSLTKEAEDELKTKEAKKKAEDLITRIIPINYSEAGKIEPTIKKSLSTRGETVVDSRTNTLIVKDITRNVDEVLALVKQLDRPTPQIMIEARIVEASLNFNRSLGVQWGGNYNANPSFGNATGLKFPNTIGVTGGPTMGGVPSGNGNYFVNMPAPSGVGTGGGAVGFQFGSLNKALNLDIVLSALESTGEGKVISTPRVSALDNKEAKIEQGVSIPYATSQAGGATNIQFIDAKLSLTVTPHATPDNRIFMKIQATKNAPDNSLLGAGGQPSIRKNEATTEILLSDGETAVIGGILVLDRGQTVNKIPFLGDIPLIGWLFRSTATREEKRELLIFITPRIVKQDVI
jgi:type IV pilus secretin PilQ/predicted competence protein